MKNGLSISGKKFLFLFLIEILFSLGSYAQQFTIKGNVVDSFGEPLTGVSITVKGTTLGTVTDLDGNFTLTLPAASVVSASYLGMLTVEKNVTPSEPVIKIEMKEDTILLNETVVIGYGSIKKSDLSGSVIAIKAEEKNKGAVTSPQELLQGKISGLYITPGDGQPGANATIRVRSGASLNSSNDPLIVIDGIPVSQDAAPGSPNALATINPNDIATFTLLKDASATAIYGSRASNGVIIITTKKATENKVKIDYTSTYSLSDPVNKVKMLSAAEFRKVMDETYPEGSTAGDKLHQIINLFPEQSTDWQDEIFRTGFSIDQNLGISGKIATLPFRISLGYTNNNGTLKTSNYERYTGNLNLNPQFLDKHLSLDINLKGTINNNRFADSGAVNAAAFFDPTKPLYNTDGRYNGYWNFENAETHLPNDLAVTNPLSLLYDTRNTGTTKRSLGNIQLDYKVHGLEDLHANLNLGYDVASGETENYVNPASFQSAKDSDFPDTGQGTSWTNLTRNNLLDFYLNYEKDLASISTNRINAMLGYSWQHFYTNPHAVNKSNPATVGEKDGWEYDNDSGRYIKNGHHAEPKENYLISFFGRINYNLMDRYLLTATFRRDGSSKFIGKNQWGNFPSVALAWSVINEPFMENNHNTLSNLKLRIGYGITGQQSIDDYQFIQRYIFGTNPSTTYLGTYLLKPAGYNPDLKWEETTTYNAAVDYGFMNNRINGSIEYYTKRSKDLLNFGMPAAGTNFVNEIVQNVGEVTNRGLEFNINAIPVKTKNFTWETGYNITWNTNKITQLTAKYNPDYAGVNAGRISLGGSAIILQKHVVDYAPSTFYLYQQIYDENGRPIQNAFVDRDKDGEITEGDLYLTKKSPAPAVYMGFSSSFSYRNWDLVPYV
jgi:iron complex outermembrane receptor protein